MKKYTKEQKQEAITYLQKHLIPKKTIVYYLITHVASSGMSRDIKFLIAVNNEIKDISWHVANLLDEKESDRGVKRQGCGMDMGFDAIYKIGSILWPKGDGRTVTYQNGDTKVETDGGYLLKYACL